VRESEPADGRKRTKRVREAHESIQCLGAVRLIPYLRIAIAVRDTSSRDGNFDLQSFETRYRGPRPARLLLTRLCSNVDVGHDSCCATHRGHRSMLGGQQLAALPIIVGNRKHSTIHDLRQL